MADPRARLGQDIGQRSEGLGRVDPTGRVVRAVDEDHPRARRDRGRDRRRRGRTPAARAARGPARRRPRGSAARRRTRAATGTRPRRRARGASGGRRRSPRSRRSSSPRRPGPSRARFARESVSATVAWLRGLLELVGEPVLVLRAEALLASASTYAGSGISCGLPTAKLATPGSSRRAQIGPSKKRLNGAMLARSRSICRTVVAILSSPGSRRSGATRDELEPEPVPCPRAS